METPPNFDPNALGPNANPNNPGRGPMIMAVLWILTGFATLVVALRLHVRRRLHALGADDWLMLAALMFQFIEIGFLTKAFSYGLGKHDGDLTFNQIVNAIKWGWLYLIPGTFVTVLARVSSGVFLDRLFGVKKWFHWYLVVFTIMQCLAGIAVILIEFAGTKPVAALWDPMITATSVSPHAALATATFAQTLFTFADFTYVVIPVAIIWGLQMSLVRRLGLIFLLCTSLVTVAASVMKILSLQTSAAQLAEPEYSSSLAALWSGVEQLMVIIMASVPVLGAMAQVEFPLVGRLTSLASRLVGASKLSTSVRSHPYSDTELSSKHQYAASDHQLGAEA